VLRLLQGDSQGRQGIGNMVVLRAVRSGG
jgi:hypothetical protein